MLSTFIYAERNKLRFPYKGSISVEELWDLSLSELDKIYENLTAKEAKQSEGKSLLASKSSQNSKEQKILDVQIAIVEYIFKTKSEELELAKAEQEKRAKDQKIMELIEKKKNEGLESMSIEELQAMLDK